MNIRRNRIIYSILILLTVVLGLCSRRFPSMLPKWVEAYAGDTLWALMVFLLVGFIFRAMKTRHVTAISLIFSYLIEISQLYHAPWIDAIRKTIIGGLVLGYGFLWSDLICYTVGVVIGVGLEYMVVRFSKIGRDKI